MRSSSGQVDLLNINTVYLFWLIEMYHLKRASLGNPEFKQRILIMHRHNDSPGKDLATLQKRNICIFSMPTWNSFLNSGFGCDRPLGILMKSCFLGICLVPITT